VRLEGKLTAEIKGISDIWLKTLSESHDWTIKVFDLTQAREQNVDNLVALIETNLANPQGEYVLDRIQLAEKIAAQEALVKYRDATAQTKDSVEEAIAVWEKRIEQTNILSQKITHISELKRLEEEYAVLTSFRSSFTTFFTKFDALSATYRSLNNIDTQINQKKAQYSGYNPKTRPETGNLYFILEKTIDRRNGQIIRLGYRSYEAQNIAASLGGNLVTVNDLQEQFWITDNFGTNFWIGLTDDHNHNGPWRWMSGEPYTWDSWQWIPGEPNNAGGETFVVSLGRADGWNDIDWEDNRRGLVEISLKPLYDQRNSVIPSIREATQNAFNALKTLYADLTNNALRNVVKGINLGFVKTYYDLYNSIVTQAGGNLNEVTLTRLQNEVFIPFAQQYNKLATAGSVEGLIANRRPSLISQLDQELSIKANNLVNDIELDAAAIHYLTSNITVEFLGQKYFGWITYDNSALRRQGQEWLSGNRIQDFGFNFLGKTYYRQDFSWDATGVSLSFVDGNPVAALFAFNTPDGRNFGFGQESGSKISWGKGFLQWDYSNARWIENVGKIDFSDPANVQHLEWQEQWLETNLQNYVNQRRDSITPSGVNDQIISILQSLRLETAYLTQQATEHPGKLNNYLF
ncbi:MAG: lectin-like protein, partial [Snowella sp.]